MDIERVLSILENYDNLTLAKEDQDSLVATLKNMDLGTLGPETRVKAEQILASTSVAEPVMENLEVVPVESNIVTEPVSVPLQDELVTNPEVVSSEPVMEPVSMEQVPLMEATPVVEPASMGVPLESNIEPVPTVTEEVLQPEIVPDVIAPEPLATPETLSQMDVEPTLEPVVQSEVLETPMGVEPVNVHLTDANPVEITTQPEILESNSITETNVVDNNSNPEVGILEEVIEEKPKPKKNPLLLVIIIVVILAVVAGVLFVLDSQGIISIPFLHSSSNNPNPIVDNNKSLSCSLSVEPDVDSKVSNTTEVSYDASGNINTITFVSKYEYKNQDKYNGMKNSYQLPDNYEGVVHSSSFDDTKMIFIVTITIKYSELTVSEKAKYEYLLTFDNAKTYYLSTGYTCNGEMGTETPNTEAPNTENPNTEDPNTEDPGTETPNTENPEKTLYAITESFAINNNLFEYSNVTFGEYDASYGKVVVSATLKNVTDATKMRNIKIEFYDADKKILGEYQDRTQLEVADDSPYAIGAGQSKVFEFTIYNQKLSFDLGNVKYITLIDIEV